MQESCRDVEWKSDQSSFAKNVEGNNLNLRHTGNIGKSPRNSL